MVSRRLRKLARKGTSQIRNDDMINRHPAQHDQIASLMRKFNDYVECAQCNLNCTDCELICDCRFCCRIISSNCRVCCDFGDDNSHLLPLTRLNHNEPSSL